MQKFANAAYNIWRSEFKFIQASKFPRVTCYVRNHRKFLEADKTNGLCCSVPANDSDLGWRGERNAVRNGERWEERVGEEEGYTTCVYYRLHRE